MRKTNAGPWDSALLAALLLSAGCGTQPHSDDEGRAQLGPTGAPLLTRSTRVRGPRLWASRPCVGTTGSIEGTWQSRGYGLALQATASEFVLYQVSESTCFEDYRGLLDGLCDPTLRLDIGSEDEPATLLFQSRVRGDVLTVRDATIGYTFDRTGALPPSCAAGVTAESADPVLNFDVLWQHFDEHYAFFDLHGVDWAAQYRTYRAQVSATTTPAELFETMARMLAPLRDYHVQLTSEDRSYVGPPPSDILMYNADLAAYTRTSYLSGP